MGHVACENTRTINALSRLPWRKCNVNLGCHSAAYPATSSVFHPKCSEKARVQRKNIYEIPYGGPPSPLSPYVSRSGRLCLVGGVSARGVQDEPRLVQSIQRRRPLGGCKFWTPLKAVKGSIGSTPAP
jgi:hypothetical protein